MYGIVCFREIYEQKCCLEIFRTCSFDKSIVRITESNFTYLKKTFCYIPYVSVCWNYQLKYSLLYVLGSMRKFTELLSLFYATASHVTCLKTPHFLAPNLYSPSLYHCVHSFFFLLANKACVHTYKSSSPQILVNPYFILTLWESYYASVNSAGSIFKKYSKINYAFLSVFFKFFFYFFI